MNRHSKEVWKLKDQKLKEARKNKRWYEIKVNRKVIHLKEVWKLQRNMSKIA